MRREDKRKVLLTGFDITSHARVAGFFRRRKCFYLTINTMLKNRSLQIVSNHDCQELGRKLVAFVTPAGKEQTA